MTPPPEEVATAAGSARPGRPAYEVAEVVQRYGDSFLRNYRTSGEQRRVLRAIRRCRTAALGGHVEQCQDCEHRRIAYNSCRNRHCPKCQTRERERWLEREQGRLLPVGYFHVVFTLPHDLNPLIRVNRSLLYGLLLRTAAATLQDFAHRRFGADLAITAVLHTWGQTLCEHVHVHCVVSAGGLSTDGQRWREPNRRGRRRPFLFPVRALSKVFRAKYLAALDRLHHRRRFRFAGQCGNLAEAARWKPFLNGLAAKKWVVYCKPPFGGPAQVVRYLSRYTHRIAISNHRITRVGDGMVRFRYRDYSDASRMKEMALDAGEFLRRFTMHVVPSGFMRIRHYGLVANRSSGKLDRCRQLLGGAASVVATEREAPPSADRNDTAGNAARCPACGGELKVVEILAPAFRDTS